MATGEVVDAEVLGGAETHAKLTGLADQLAVDEYVHWQAIIDGIGRLMLDRIDAIRKAREWVTALPSPIPQQLPNLESANRSTWKRSSCVLSMIRAFPLSNLASVRV
jgi:acetyl-CoA carboxylase carboxyltransferase component